MAADDAGGLTLSLDHVSVHQMHHGLEEVVVDPQVVIEPVGGQDVGNGVEAKIAEVVADKGTVLLLDVGVVVLLIGAGAS